MKKIVLSILLVSIYSNLSATIKLSEDEQKKWEISLSRAKEVDKIPLLKTNAKVKSAPDAVVNISMPYDIKIIKLYKYESQSVKKGEILATIQSDVWLETQQEMLDASMEYEYTAKESKRKEMLCNEGIIAKKECLVENSSLAKATSRVQKAKAMLLSFGVESVSKISPSLDIKSPKDGYILNSNALLGQFRANETIFSIRGNEEAILSINIAKNIALDIGTLLHIQTKDNTFDAKVISLSKSVNAKNQTKTALLSIPKSINLIDEEILEVMLFIDKKALLVDKNALSSMNAKEFIFIKDNDGFEAKEVEVLYEDKNSCYIKYDDNLTSQIASSKVSILQSRYLEGSEDE